MKRQFWLFVGLAIFSLNAIGDEATEKSKAELQSTLKKGMKPWSFLVERKPEASYSVTIKDENNRTIQVLDLAAPESDPEPFDAEKVIAFKDFNGDGWKDLWASEGHLSASPEPMERLFLFNPKIRKFEDQAAVFKQQGMIDSKGGRGCIVNEYRNPDNMTYSFDRYCWRNGKWKRIASKARSSRGRK